MPTSFESMHTETRPLALLEREAATPRRRAPWATMLTALLPLIVPIVVFVLL